MLTFCLLAQSIIERAAHAQNNASVLKLKVTQYLKINKKKKKIGKQVLQCIHSWAAMDTQLS